MKTSSLLVLLPFLTAALALPAPMQNGVDSASRYVERTVSVEENTYNKRNDESSSSDMSGSKSGESVSNSDTNLDSDSDKSTTGAVEGGAETGAGGAKDTTNPTSQGGVLGVTTGTSTPSSTPLGSAPAPGAGAAGSTGTRLSQDTKCRTSDNAIKNKALAWLTSGAQNQGTTQVIITIAGEDKKKGADFKTQLTTIGLTWTKDWAKDPTTAPKNWEIESNATPAQLNQISTIMLKEYGQTCTGHAIGV